MKVNMFFNIVFSIALFAGSCSNAQSNTGSPKKVITSVDSIVVEKNKREMSVFFKDTLLKKYHVSLGFTPVGEKCFQGDGKTPEGLYFINDKNPYSDYHKNLSISYPDVEDIVYAKKFGKSAGGDIKIHGYPNGYTAIDVRRLAPDWTLGCIAVSNIEIDELFTAVPIGTPILILP